MMLPDVEHPCTAVLDANVIFDLYVRDVLLNLADDGRYTVRWSGVILQEMRWALADRIPETVLGRTIRAMNGKFPRAIVQGTHPAAATPLLPDPNDRHVLSAAMAAKADFIVTNNLRDFPEAILGPVEIEAISADTFLTWLYRHSPAETLRVVMKQCQGYKRPPIGTLEEFADLLEWRGLDTFTRALRGRHTSWRASPSFR